MPMFFYLPIIIWGGLMAPYLPSPVPVRMADNAEAEKSLTLE